MITFYFQVLWASQEFEGFSTILLAGFPLNYNLGVTAEDVPLKWSHPQAKTMSSGQKCVLGPSAFLLAPSCLEGRNRPRLLLSLAPCFLKGEGETRAQGAEVRLTPYQPQPSKRGKSVLLQGHPQEISRGLLIWGQH